jgi:hypothetical protein
MHAIYLLLHVFLRSTSPTKANFSLKKPVTISLRRSLAPSLALQKFLPKRLYLAFKRVAVADSLIGSGNLIV